MDPLQPWVDAAEVRRLAARLLQPVRNPAAEVPAGEAGFSEGFIGFTGGQPATAQPPAHLPAPAPAPIQVARTSPATPAPVTAIPTATSAPQSARGPFLEKIRRFRDWMAGQFGAAGLFILDREGAVIFDEGTHGRLHFLARSLALASRRPGASAGNVHVKIGATTTLEVIPVETPYGCLVLGAVVSEALPPAAVQAVMAALAAITSPDSPAAPATPSRSN